MKPKKQWSGYYPGKFAKEPPQRKIHQKSLIDFPPDDAKLDQSLFLQHRNLGKRAWGYILETNAQSYGQARSITDREWLRGGLDDRTGSYWWGAGRKTLELIRGIIGPHDPSAARPPQKPTPLPQSGAFRPYNYPPSPPKPEPVVGEEPLKCPARGLGCKGRVTAVNGRNSVWECRETADCFYLHPERRVTADDKIVGVDQE